MMKKNLVWLLVIFFGANISVTHSQQPRKISQIGFLIGGSHSSLSLR